MTEKTDKTEKTEYSRWTVRIGHDGETRPVRFRAREIGETTNYANRGPNQNRYHRWTLFEIPDGRYRVFDEYNTCWQGERGHSSLSDPLTGMEVAAQYPRVSHDFLPDEETIIDLDGEEDD